MYGEVFLLVVNHPNIPHFWTKNARASARAEVLYTIPQTLKSAKVHALFIYY